MLTALSNGKIISAYTVTKKMIQGETKMEFISRYDKSKMVFVSESHNGRSAHFRHTVIPEFLEKKYGKGGESKKHLLAKADLMKTLYQRRPNEIIVIDEDFKTFKAERIPDISVFDSSTYKIIEVHEIQLSQIAHEQIIERTNFYIENGVDVITWWFDDAAKWHGTPLLKNYLWEHDCKYGLITFRTEIVTDEI